jgi:tripartite ATP-independent transporter DctM subunit
MAVASLEATKTVLSLRAPLYKFTRILNGIGMGLLTLLMTLMTLDVILRYIFNRPIPGSMETLEFILAILVAFGFGYTAMKKGHVSVSVFTDKLSPKGQAYVETINSLICLVLSALVTWQLVLFGNLMLSGGMTTSVLRLPVYPVVYAVAFGFAVLSLVYLYEAFENGSKVYQASKTGGLLILTAAVIVIFSIFAVLAIYGISLIQITPITAGVIGILLLVAMVFTNIPIGFVMAIIGFVGMSFVAGIHPGLASIGSSPYSTISAYSFSVIPMFVLMGSFCFFSGLSRDLYYAVYKWIGHLPGGLAMATVGACAGFAAISGSSVATVATLGTVAFPEMKKYNYDSKLATGCIAVGGGLGVLIPPSLILAIYGILTEESIGKLFLAGFLPGIIEAIFLMITIYIMCKMNPSLGPKGEVSTFKEKIVSLKSVWGVGALFLLVIGGIYTGIFTPTEAAGVGAAGALILTVLRKQLTKKNFIASLQDTGGTTSMCFMILVGATVLGYFLAITRLPNELSMMITTLELNRYLVIGVIFVIYFVLGMVMSSIAMVILTVPIFFPIVTGLGFEAIWFGIIVVKLTEIAMITPPVGINVFVMSGIAKDDPMYTIFKGIIPFLITEFACIGLLLVFPQIVNILPNMMR